MLSKPTVYRAANSLFFKAHVQVCLHVQTTYVYAERGSSFG